MNLPPTIEEFTALQQALREAHSQRESLASELQFVRVERDLLKERLNKFMRKIFAAKSEVSSQDQKDMFFVFNEAEVLGTADKPFNRTSRSIDLSYMTSATCFKPRANPGFPARVTGSP